MNRTRYTLRPSASTSYGPRLHKIKSTRPIDAAVALAMCADYFAAGEAAPPGLIAL